MVGAIGIGVMCKAPRAGLAKTRLAPVLGSEGAARLSEAFLRDVLATAERAAAHFGARLYAFVRPASEIDDMRALFPPDIAVAGQVEGDLGAVMWAALDAMRQQCANGAILIGSDIPLLPLHILEEAAAALREADAVFGPAEDGGYYLVGVRGPEARPLFDPLPWSTADVMRLTRARAKALGLKLQDVATWWDVDEPADLDRLRAAILASPGSAPATATALGYRAAAVSGTSVPPETIRSR